MNRSTRRGITRSALLLATIQVTSAPLGAQASVVAYINLKSATGGQFMGESTNPAFAHAIVPYKLTVSPATASAPTVLHMLISATTAPQAMHALARNEPLVLPTITFARLGGSGQLQPFYVIKAQTGYIQAAQIALDTQHVPAMMLDVALGGSVSYSDGAGVRTSAPAPSITGALPSGATIITGEFTTNTGTFPPASSSPQHLGIPLDRISIQATNAVSVAAGASGAVSAGRAVIEPLVIQRPSDQDAAQFAATQANGNHYSRVVVHVFIPSPNRSLVEAFRITTNDVSDGEPPAASGAGATKPGASTRLAPGATSARVAAVAPLERIATTSATPPVTMRLAGNNATLTITNMENQTTASIP